MNDLISRRAAIELAMQYCPDDDGTCSKADEDIRNLLDELEALPSAQPEFIRNLLDELEALPSAQPEFIRCGKCTHKDKKIDYCHYLGITICECDYCSYAVRRTDELGNS